MCALKEFLTSIAPFEDRLNDLALTFVKFHEKGKDHVLFLQYL